MNIILFASNLLLLWLLSWILTTIVAVEALLILMLLRSRLLHSLLLSSALPVQKYISLIYESNYFSLSQAQQIYLRRVLCREVINARNGRQNVPLQLLSLQDARQEKHLRIWICLISTCSYFTKKTLINLTSALWNFLSTCVEPHFGLVNISKEKYFQVFKGGDSQKVKNTHS